MISGMREQTSSKRAGQTSGTGGGASRTTPHRRARQDRGLETRDRLVEAALDVFGRRGFEGASTREIAKAAGANLAAIVYHFGSKDALYLAVAEHVVASIRARVGPAIALIQSQVDQLDPAAARMMVAQLLGTMVDVIVGNPEAERWARFMIREQLDPTAAFEVIYGFMGEAHALVARMVGIATAGDPESANVKIRAFTVIGQGLVFRIAQTMVLRRLGRDGLGPAEREEIKKVLRENVAAILSGGADDR
jgi:AcrR family transcriptional regulator